MLRKSWWAAGRMAWSPLLSGCRGLADAQRRGGHWTPAGPISAARRLWTRAWRWRGSRCARGLPAARRTSTRAVSTRAARCRACATRSSGTRLHARQGL